MRVLIFIKNSLSFFLPWLGLMGLILLTKWYKNTREPSNGVYALLSLVAIFVYIVFLVLPYITLSYDLNRLDQQLLIVAGPTILIGVTFLERINRRVAKKHVFIGLYCILFLIFSSGIVQQYYGGQNVSLRYNNSGLNYAKYYTVQSDVVSAMWLQGHVEKDRSLSADYFSTNRLSLYLDPHSIDKVNTNVLLAIFQPKTYIYISSVNNEQGVALNPYKGKTLVYLLPIGMINQNKNQIYSNGKSAVYR
jgi:uncharacterized membrane protein